MLNRDAVALRVVARAMLAALMLFAMMIMFAPDARALEFEALPKQGSRQADDDGAQTFSIKLPAPVDRFDRCQSMLNHLRDSGALSASQDHVPDNRGLSFVVGFRFALNAPAHEAAHVALWEPIHGMNRQALAMREYEDCRKGEALRAAFGE